MAVHKYQMSINYNAGGQFCSNILHFTFDDGGFTTTAAAAQGLCAGWDAANRTRLRNMLPSAVSILSYRARSIDVAGGFEGGINPTGGVAGVRSGDMPVAGVGPVSILYGTGNGKQRGRIFWPGITGTDCNNGYIESALRAVINTSMGGIISVFPTVGGGAVAVQPVIYSRTLNQVFNVAAAQVSPMVGQVRRRNLPA